MNQPHNHELSRTRPTRSAHGRPDQAAQSQQFDPWILWVTFRRCWPWAVPIGAVLSAIAAFAVVETFEPRYKASALLEANDDRLLPGILVPTVSEELAESEKQLIFNPRVLDGVIDDPSLQNAPSLSDPRTAEKMLRENLAVRSAGSKNRMTVAFEGTHKAFAAKICNAVVDSYLRLREEFDNARVSNLERWLAPEIASWEREVKDRQEKVQQLSESIVGYSAGRGAAVLEDESQFELLNGLRTQISDLEVDLALMEASQKARSDLMKDMQLAENDQEPDSDSEVDDLPEFVPPEIKVERFPASELAVNELVQRAPAVRDAASMVAHYQAQLLRVEADGLSRVHRDYYRDTERKLGNWKEKLRQAQDKLKPILAQKLANEDYERRRREADRKIEAARLAHEAEIARLRQKRANVKTPLTEAGGDELLVEYKLMRADIVEKLSLLRSKYNDEKLRLERLGHEAATLQFAIDDLAVASDVLVRLRNRVAAVRTERQKGGTVRTLARATEPRGAGRVGSRQENRDGRRRRVCRPLFVRAFLGIPCSATD